MIRSLLRPVLHPVRWRDGRRYRRTYGKPSYSRDQLDAMWADPNCPVRHRPLT